VGKKTPVKEIESALKDNKAAAETFDRFRKHLANNDVELNDKTEAVLGAFLEMNPKTERFTNNEKANGMLKRDYRKPFEVPENV